VFIEELTKAVLEAAVRPTGAADPGRGEFGPEGNHHQDRTFRQLIDRGFQQFECAGVGPVRSRSNDMSGQGLKPTTFVYGFARRQSNVCSRLFLIPTSVCGGVLCRNSGLHL